MNLYKAHKNEQTNEIQTVKEHSENTAQLCEAFAIEPLKKVAYVMGLLHDVGKYQKSFQKRIDGKNIRVEHSTCGAVVAKEKYNSVLGLLMQYCIAGHHSGIPDGGFPTDSSDQSTLAGRMKRNFEDFTYYQQELILPDLDIDTFISYLQMDCKSKTMVINKFAFFVRYGFSCLVDADSIDTARFCNQLEQRGLQSDFSACLEKLNICFGRFVCETPLQKSREKLQGQVFSQVEEKADLYLMNMPTGSGKTLCSMKFALERAIRERKKRIIYVIPYNSIIEQTADIFEQIFGEAAEILRHQSTFCIEEDFKGEESDKLIAKLATENWDAQIIITTAVQFFESLYSNQRGKLRKLHNMAESILIFDEIHTLPLAYLQPCLEGIAFITKYLNSKAVFLTATMPNFIQWMQQHVMSSLSFRNLIADQSCFSVFQKCTYHYLSYISQEGLLEKAKQNPSSLIIVNKRRTARELYHSCGGKKYHLSTYMTALDRSRVIKEIKEELDCLERDDALEKEIPEERRITVISTSLIEAGVDLDFHTVFRELSGLEHILQSAGRCNREGKRKSGDVYIFEWEEERGKPKKDISAEITRGMFLKKQEISDQACIGAYYDRVFSVAGEALTKQAMYQYTDKLFALPFETYAKNFQLIESDTISVVVACDAYSRTLVEGIQQNGYGDIRKLQKYVFSVYPYEFEQLRQQGVVEDFGSGIWCLTNLDYYDQEVGVLFETPDYYL